MNFRRYFTGQAEIPGEVITTPQALRGYRVMSPDAYRALPAVNASVLKNATAGGMLESMTQPEADHYSATRATPFTLGTLVHIICLEPHRMKPAAGEAMPDWMLLSNTKGLATKDAKEQRAENPGKLLVTPELVANAAEMTRAIWQQDEARNILSMPGRNEVTGVLFLPGGTWRKWRPDRVVENGTRIIDVKTTRLTLEDPREWERECWDKGYFLQAAWYLDCHERLTGVRPNCFQFLAVCTEERRYHARVFTVFNPAPGTHLWDKESALNRARRTLGLDTDTDATGSPVVSRLDRFTTSARDTIAEADTGRELTPALMRQLWPDFEHETDGPVIGLPQQRKL